MVEEDEERVAVRVAVRVPPLPNVTREDLERDDALAAEAVQLLQDFDQFGVLSILALDELERKVGALRARMKLPDILDAVTAEPISMYRDTLHGSGR